MLDAVADGLADASGDAGEGRELLFDHREHLFAREDVLDRGRPAARRCRVLVGFFRFLLGPEIDLDLAGVDTQRMLILLGAAGAPCRALDLRDREDHLLGLGAKFVGLVQ